MKKLFSNKAALIIFCVGLLVLVSLMSAYSGATYALRKVDFKTVTPTQLATAMREDRFWSTYRFNVLIFEGTIESVGVANGHFNVKLKTNDPYTTTCEITDTGSNLDVGKNIKLEAASYQAQREPSGVLLHKCMIL